MLITKADGAQEDFDIAKLLSSLRRARADDDTAEHVARAVEKELEPGMTTSAIYAKAFAHLRRHPQAAAARYSLKRAILDFGPSGFPFEAYIAEVLRAEGYETAIDQMVVGKCVSHEVDVVAKKEKETLYVEAKFHNSPAYKTDLKTVLYVKARMDDIAKGRGLVVTNTKFTSAAVQYAGCVNLELLGWEQPEGATLHDRIDRAGVYPITALTSLSSREKTALLNEKMVLCNDLAGREEALAGVGITSTKLHGVLEEASNLCRPGKGV